MGPDGPAAFALYWRAQHLPFIGLADPDHQVARRYMQEVNLFKLGRMPLIVVIDSQGMVRFAHHGSSMADIPDNSTLLEVIDRIRAASA